MGQFVKPGTFSAPARKQDIARESRDVGAQ